MDKLKPQNRDIELQPKQESLYELVEHGLASWIGAGGGRGAAKSSAIDRIMYLRRTGKPGTIGAIIMRNHDQLVKYHIDPMLRDFPELADLYHITESKFVIPMPVGPPSEIHFRHAESLDDIERVFRSASYYDVMVDQAEQFTKEELKEIKKVVRWKRTDIGACKFLLAFNMGGDGIGFLQNIFDPESKEYGENEDPADYTFLQFNPWDNVEWSRAALERDGLSPQHYYEVFTEQERMDYCAATAYGRTLVAQDPALKNRDWYGSWKALEGAFFGRVFDEDSAVIHPEQVARLLKPWSKRWVAEDWGKGHYCFTLWNAMVDVSPADALDILGWQITKPLKAVVSYREYVAGGAAADDEGGENEIAEQDIAREIVDRSPEDEREAIRAFFLSPDAFEMSVRRAGQNEIAQVLGKILKAGGLPYPTKADNSRISGWSLMYNLLLETKRHGATGETCWLISANCPELKKAIPLLMRNPKNLDDVLKTDKTKADIKMDAADTARYALKSMLSPGKPPKQDVMRDAILAAMYRRQAPVNQAPRMPLIPGAIIPGISRYASPGPAVAAPVDGQPVPDYSAAHMAHLRAEQSIKKQTAPLHFRRNRFRRH